MDGGERPRGGLAEDLFERRDLASDFVQRQSEHSASPKRGQLDIEGRELARHLDRGAVAAQAADPPLGQRRAVDRAQRPAQPDHDRHRRLGRPQPSKRRSAPVHDNVLALQQRPQGGRARPPRDPRRLLDGRR